jgi:hypothetical protein
MIASKTPGLPAPVRAVRSGDSLVAKHAAGAGPGSDGEYFGRDIGTA